MVLFLMWGSVVVGQESKPHQKAGDVAIEKATVRGRDVGSVEYELGTLFVRENRAEATSRLIGVGFARFKALGKPEAPPVFLLPGGPGSSYLPELKGAGMRPGLVADVQRMRAFADVVLVDQRGFSERGDVLRHRHSYPADPANEPGSLERSTRAFAELARSASAAFAQKGFDLRGYTVKECANDVAELATALGYQQVILFGGSFGSQWSFAIMKQHPTRVARALLTGVEPLDHGYDMPGHVVAAMQRIWFDADRDERLKPYLPPGGVMAAARDVVRRLEREPVRVTLAGVKDAQTGEPVTITLGVEDFRRAPALRTTEGPAFILTLYHGKYDQWAAMMNMQRRGRTVDFPLIGALIDSSLGVTPKRLHQLRTDPGTMILGHWNFDSYLATAEIWPTPDVGDDFRTAVDCEIPVVFVHGNWDTSTPIENVLEVLPYFRHGRLMVVERGGHGALGQVSRQLPKVYDQLLNYLKTGDHKGLPTRVEVSWPRFSVPSFPAPERK
jgi:pimeloyl-ACP methyl ester carboxylesterase